MKKNNKINMNTATNYPVGDFLIRIKNACMAKRKSVSVRNSKFVYSVAKALEKEGYLSKVEAKDGELKVSITYFKKEPVMIDLKLISRPGLRIYMSVDEIEKQRGPERFFLSTPLGVVSSKDAIKNRVGGEVIAKVL